MVYTIYVMDNVRYITINYFLFYRFNFIRIKHKDLNYRSLKYINYIENKWLEYANKPSFFYYIQLLYYHYIDIDYIFIKFFNISDKRILNCCDYNILLWKLKIFYIWDIEKELNIKESYLKVVSEVLDDENPDDVDVTIEYKLNKSQVLKIYYENLPNIKLDEFWDFYKNKEFYQKMILYSYDIEFTESDKYKNSNEFFDKFTSNIFWEYQEKENSKKKEEYINKELKSYREEWNVHLKDKTKKDKYEKIFFEIEKIKKKIKWDY